MVSGACAENATAARVFILVSTYTGVQR
jgi:hypothetical protein